MIRFFTTGWTVQIGRVQLRWNRQGAYKALSVEFLSGGFAQTGGVTWTQRRRRRRDPS